jgi:hypothetical protein
MRKLKERIGNIGRIESSTTFIEIEEMKRMMRKIDPIESISEKLPDLKIRMLASITPISLVRGSSL